MNNLKPIMDQCMRFKMFYYDILQKYIISCEFYLSKNYLLIIKL